jgi:hypothetical protein
MPLAHLADRALLRLSGADARPFLQGLLTQDMGQLAPGRPAWAGLLSPQGKALFAFLLHDAGDAILIDCVADSAEALARRLLMFRLRKDVAIAPCDLAVWAAWSDAAAGLPPDPRAAGLGARWVAPAGAHAPDAGIEAYHAHRLALGIPDQESIGSDSLLWLEANARELNGVSFTKGCYTGQENTARMHHRDKVRKRLLPLRLSGGAPADAPVLAGDREAGTLRGMRVAGLQLALLRMEHAGGPLTVAGEPAELLWPGWLPLQEDDGDSD